MSGGIYWEDPCAISGEIIEGIAGTIPRGNQEKSLEAFLAKTLKEFLKNHRISSGSNSRKKIWIKVLKESLQKHPG